MMNDSGFRLAALQQIHQNNPTVCTVARKNSWLHRKNENRLLENVV